MFGTRELARVAVMILPVATLAPATGFAFELSGAWASQQDLCSRVFTKRGNAITFAELSDLFGSGFLIDGNRIRGRTAKCTISSRKQDGDNIELAASCATSIMNQSVKFNLKILDDNTIVRNFSDIPDMTLRYSRCKL